MGALQGGLVLRASCGGCGVGERERRGYVLGECEDWQRVCVCLTDSMILDADRP